MRQCPKCGKRFIESSARICDLDGAVLDLVVVASERERLVGTTLMSRYAVTRVLGDGGMGVVYHARSLNGRREFAVKVLRAEYSAEEDLVARFDQEARAAEAVGNPHIVSVYDRGALPDGSRFFVMEYLQGQSLGDLLNAQPRPPGADRRDPLAEPLALHLSKQIADGLGAAHAAGVVHRDIKPDNFHLVQAGDDPYFVKILDFGIAKVQDSKAARTRTGSVFGTPHYMSPEQASGERNIDATTDIYGLGVLMYEMVAGKVPFDADNLMGVLTAHLYHSPTPPRIFPGCEGLSAGFEAVILKCLAKTREARYASMAELYQDLERCERGEPTLALEEQDQKTMRFTRPSQAEPSLAQVGRSGPLADSGPLDQGPPVSPLVAGAPNVLIDALGDATVPPGVAPVPTPAERLRSRATLVAVILGTGTAIGFVLFTLLGLRQPTTATPTPRVQPTADVVSARPAPVPSTPSTAADPLGAPITIECDAPQATVSRGRERVGDAPVEVPRPAQGEDLYEISAPGRLAVTIRVGATSPPVMRVALPRRAVPVPGARADDGGAPSRPGRPTDLRDPWAEGN